MRDPQRLAHDRVQVDEHVLAQQVVDLVLARRVLGHQPLQRGRFVGGVVVHVQVRIALEPLVDEVDELLERAAFLVACVRPERFELLAAIHHTEEVLEAA